MEELPDLRVHRPYSSLDEYLEGDFWTVERKEMFLIGAQSYDVGVAVRFTIELEDGTPVVTGEGRVVEYTAPSEDFPGGLKVRFRQLDAEAKAVLRRALEVRRRAYQAQLEAQAAPSDADGAAHGSVTASDGAAHGSGASPAAPIFALPSPPVISVSSSSTTSLGPDLLAVSVTPARPVSAPHAPPKPRTGMRPRAKIISAPPDRDALLGRLRARRSLQSAGSGK